MNCHHPLSVWLRLLAGGLLLGLIFMGLARPAHAQGPIRVTTTGSGSGDGSDWTTNAASLQHALSIATSGDEIWVATGVYTPGLTQSDTFTITSGVQLYGGFAATETLRTQRDWLAHPTILSGDIGGDDTTTNGVVTDVTQINGNNSYHVIWADGVTGNPITATTIVDGFTVTAGQATGGGGDNLGGGFYCAGSGGGHKCSPSLSHLTFSGNLAKYGGGAMYNDGYSGVSSPSLSNVAFSGNSASDGGAMYNYGPSGTSSPSLSNVIFSGNSASSNGGAMANIGLFGASSPSLSNVTFSGNSASSNGGAMFNDGTSSGSSSPSLTNVILWGNQAGNGNQLYNSSASPVLSYTLIQSGTNDIVNNSSSVTFGPGILTGDPLFVAPITATAAPTTTGNYRLQTGSPAIDTGLTSAITLTTDLDGTPRIQGNAVDLGAYEAAPSLPDVTISKTVSPASAKPGDSITYTLTFSNAGPSLASGVIITDSVPGSVTNISVSSSGATITNTGAAPDFVWQVADLPPNAGGVITITGVLTQPLAAGVLTNTAEIAATGDSTPANNSSAAGLTVQNVAPQIWGNRIDYLSQWGSTGTGDGEFINPTGVAIDGSGSVYVVDTFNNRIQKFDSDGAYLTQWGSYGSGDGEFDSPYGVAVDGNGDVYVVDQGNNRIQKFDSDGAYLTQWGSYGNGDGEFDAPYGVAIDGSDNVYVTDYNNNRIQKFYSDGNYMSSIDNGGGQLFYTPAGVAVDGSGYIYMVDENNSHILKFDSSGAYVTQWGSSGSDAGQFIRPTGVAVDGSGYVYVVDTYGHRLQQFDSSGCFVTQWGTYGSDPGQFGYPRGVAVDGSGNVVVADSANHRLQQLSTFGPLSDAAVTMSEDSSPCAFNLTLTATDTNSGDTFTWSMVTLPISGTATASGTGITKTIGYTPALNWYGADSFAVAVSDGALSDTVTVNVTVQSVNDAPVALDDPNKNTTEDTALTISPLLNDTDVESDTLSLNEVGSPAHGMTVISGTTQVVYTPAANYTGPDSFTYIASDGSLTGTATITVTVNPVNDAPVIVLTSLVTQWGGGGTSEGQFDNLYGVEVDSQGNVYVLDTYNNRLQKFDPDGNFISAWGWGVATGSSSYEICTGSCQAGIRGSGDGQFDTPYFLAIDSQDKVYVADFWNDRIQKFDSDGTYLTQWSSFNGSDSLSSPHVIAIDQQDNIYVGDYGDDRVVKFDSSGNYLTEWDATDSDNGEFYWIYGLAVDCDSNVYVYDAGYDNVQKFDSDGNFLLSWDATDSANGEFYDVYDLVADCGGHVYIPDYYYQNIQKFTSSGAYLGQWPVAGSPAGMTDIGNNGYFYVADYDGKRILKYDRAATSVTMSEDASPTPFALTLTATDPDAGDTLTWSIATQPLSGTATTGGTGLTKTIGYTPTLNFNGVDSFTVSVNDGALTDTATITVTVQPGNDAPLAVDDTVMIRRDDNGDLFVLATQPMTIPVLLNDSTGLTVSAVGSGSQGGAVAINANNLWVDYTPTAAFTGTETFTYTARDGGGLTDMATVTVTVVNGDGGGSTTPTAPSDKTIIIPNTGLSGTITVTVQIPAGVATDTLALVYNRLEAPGNPLPRGFVLVGLSFTLDAYLNQVLQPGYVFSTPITLTLEYSDADVADIPQGEGSLQLRYWDEASQTWRGDGITIIERDTTHNRLIVTIAHLTEFALLGGDTSPIYLPFITHNFIAAPDLIITELSATGGNITVKLENQGTAAVTDAFWVDVYFNPTQTPGLNQPWPAIAPAGAVWGVTDPIAAGETLTLAVGDAYYAGQYSSASFPAGAQVYGYGDSVNQATNYGGVQEIDESNNLAGPVVSTAQAGGDALTGQTGDEISLKGLPKR